jgi:protein-S-isoprenylcysteine O-methyltransferase Ste14
MMRDHAGVFIPPPLIFAIPLAGSALLEHARSWPISSADALARGFAGAALVAAGALVALAGVRAFRHASTTVLPAGRPTTAIVDRGPYRYTRNPMYVGMALAYVGIAILLNTVWALVLFPVALLVVDRFVIQREERYLTAKFGQTYQEYCSRVRRWI